MPRPSKFDFYSSVNGDDPDAKNQIMSDQNSDKLEVNLSLEYSKNVEANSEGSNDIKYLLGEKINVKEFERKQPTNKKKTIS